ncbi:MULTISPECIES: hypothetical protein [Mycobacteroides]|uniref:Uncharacterized protein n=1 Tax=Mycobacteroides chelonae TaxID=1774 RepID=A0AB73TY47_MYCCH|nr:MULTISPECIES: hypothetical protein [Mycobacteroides]QDF69411.1 hypothetical protein FJK96_03985 [Mycobacteroides chelonae]CPR84243.1 Uncharacterised protein [Mycobacteroides abscessus]CPS03637.1 Uncharacterised protein [Mycobacteroides abscessus]CPT03965.1 Uncharacterised protein [Mycobacteroides abscessus]CPU33251.1 Uncharacterised protein [Mycobacteroides abscessus]
MNAIYAPIALMIGAVGYGKHTAGHIKGSPLSPKVYVGRHRRNEQAEALSDFFTDRDSRAQSSAAIRASEAGW